MNYDQMIADAKRYAEQNYLNKEKLSNDEELQLLSCAYSVLYLSACANKSSAELGSAHRFIADCFIKIGDKNFSDRHLKMADTYNKT